MKLMKVFRLFLVCMILVSCNDIPEISFTEALKAEYGYDFFQELGVHAVQHKEKLKKAEFLDIRKNNELPTQRIYYEKGLPVEIEYLSGDISGRAKLNYTDAGELLCRTQIFGNSKDTTEFVYKNGKRICYVNDNLAYTEYLSSVKNELFLERKKTGYKKRLRIKYKHGVVQEWQNDNHRFVFNYKNGKIESLTDYIQQGQFGERLFNLYEVFYEGDYISEIDFYDFDRKTGERQIVRKTFYTKYDSHGNWTETYVQGRYDTKKKKDFKRIFEYED